MEFSRLKFTYKLRKVLLFLGLVFVFPEFSHGSEFYDRGKGDSSEEHSFFIGRGFIPHESVEYKDLRVSTKTDSTENIQRSKPISNKENVLKVLGKEEHLKFPNMAIGRLISYFYKEDGKSHVVLGKGTAVMISPHCALTSGHNIRRLSNIDGYPNAATSWIFYPGFYGENVYFEETAEKIKVCRQWYMDQDKDYDLGLLYFEKPIGLTTGYIRLKISTEADLLGKKIKILGYPGYEKRKPCSSSGTIRKLNDEKSEIGKIYYDADTAAGVGGAPVMLEPSEYPTCIGIHTTGGHEKKDGSFLNGGVLITKEKYETIKRWLGQLGEISED